MPLYRMVLTTTHEVLVQANDRDDAAEIAWRVAEGGEVEPDFDTEDHLITDARGLPRSWRDEAPWSADDEETRTVKEILAAKSSEGAS